MEVFFLDVAQGTCQVILLGAHRAIIIDCGSKPDGGNVLLRFLLRMGVQRIEHLVVSHSHSDHLGGAIKLLAHFQDRIGKIWYVQDHRFLETRFAIRLHELLKSGRLQRGQLDRLECSEEPKLVWVDEGRLTRLRVYSPTPGDNFIAQIDQTPNPTSAVLFLDIGGHRIIFAADSDVAQWREIFRKYEQRMKCEVLAVPHHAGRSHNGADDLNWLLDQALDVNVAIISVGTANTHGHPRQDVVTAMTNRGTKVLCTQITSRCHTDLESLRPSVLRPLTFLGRSSPVRDFTSSGNSRNVGCAGTVRVEATATGLIIDRLNDHQRAVDQLPRTAVSCPLCRLQHV